MTDYRKNSEAAINRLRELMGGVSREEFDGKATPWIPQRWALSEGFAYKGRSRQRQSGQVLDGLSMRRPFVESLANTDLTRAAVRKIVRDAGDDGERLVEAFIAVMAWGFPPRKFGPYRTSVMLTPASGAPDPVEVLPQVVRALNVVGPLEGYRKLARQLEGCGPAFGTKFLYFASDEFNQAPILDDMVARWMYDKGVRGDKGRPISSHGWSVRDYEDYLRFLRFVSSEVDEPDLGLLEYSMFVDQQFDDYLATGKSLPNWIRHLSEKQ